MGLASSLRARNPLGRAILPNTGVVNDGGDEEKRSEAIVKRYGIIEHIRRRYARNFN